MTTLESMSGLVTPEMVASLRARVEGTVVAPEDSSYDEARQGWNLAVQKRPALILASRSAADVVEGVRFAREAGLGVAVQATGHGASRAADGALLIVTSELTGVSVDAEAQTARIAAGMKWGPVLAEAQAAGLAPLLGSSPGVGAVGYTLGGGLGWLARKYGTSADSVVAFEVVTADGELRRASETENPDLFWALRGGGGSFGVITAMEVKLYPVTTVYGGNLFYPLEMAREVYARYRDWIADAPDELTSSIVLMNFPPMPMVPEPLRGQSFVMVRGCYCGPVEEGEALVNQWREWRAPAMDMFGPMPFTEVAAISNDPKDPMPAFVSTMWLHELSDEAIETIIGYGAPSSAGPSPFTVVEVRHAGGQVAQGGSAFDGREDSLLLEVIGAAMAPGMFEAMAAHMANFRRDMAPYRSDHLYVNFLDGDEKWERTREAYLPETYARLTALKAQYDPDDLFRYSLNIPPAAG